MISKPVNVRPHVDFLTKLVEKLVGTPDCWRYDDALAAVVTTILLVQDGATVPSDRTSITQAQCAVDLLGKIRKLQQESDGLPTTKGILWKALCEGWAHADSPAFETFFAEALAQSEFVGDNSDECNEFTRVVKETLTHRVVAADRYERLLTLAAKRTSARSHVVNTFGHIYLNRAPESFMVLLLKSA